MAKWEHTVDLFVVIYTSILLGYIYVMYVLLKSKNKVFKNSYFLMFVATGVHDIVFGLAAEYMRLTARVELGSNLVMVYQVAAALTHSERVIHSFSNLFMAFYQFTGIWWARVHNRLWTRKNTVVLLVLINVTTYIVYAHVFFSPFGVLLDDKGQWKGVARTEAIPKTRILNVCISIGFMVLLSILTFSTYIGAFTKSREETRKNIPEKSIFLISIVQLVFSSFDVIFQAMQFFNMRTPTNIFEIFILDYFPVWSFVTAELNAISLPLFSKTFRKEVSSRTFKVAQPIVTVTVPFTA